MSSPCRCAHGLEWWELGSVHVLEPNLRKDGPRVRGGRELPFPHPLGPWAPHRAGVDGSSSCVYTSTVFPFRKLLRPREAATKTPPSQGRPRTGLVGPKLGSWAAAEVVGAGGAHRETCQDRITIPRASALAGPLPGALSSDSSSVSGVFSPISPCQSLPRTPYGMAGATLPAPRLPTAPLCFLFPRARSTT